jgi:hypothetical protein
MKISILNVITMLLFHVIFFVMINANFFFSHLAFKGRGPHHMTVFFSRQILYLMGVSL